MTVRPREARLLSILAVSTWFLSPGACLMSSDDSSERNGAQVFMARCMEPSTNTPGAQRRIDAFVHPFLKGLGVQVDSGKGDRDRWLKDRCQSAGLARVYGFGDPVEVAWLHRNLGIAIDAHAAEVVVFMDHTNCGERTLHWVKTHGRPPSPEEETENIRASLLASERRLREWEHTHRGVDAPALNVILCVGLVTGEHAACRRRFNGVQLLSEFLEGKALPPAIRRSGEQPVEMT